MKKDYRTGILDVHWSIRLFAMLPVCIVVDYLGFRLVSQLAFAPFWLEHVGTFLAAFLGGPLYAVLVGVLYQLWAAVSSGAAYGLPFGVYALLCSFGAVGCGASMGIAVRLGLIQSWKKATAAGVLIGALSAMVEFPVTMVLSGGNFYHNFFISNFYRNVLSLGVMPWLTPLVNLACRIVAEIVDKTLTVWIVYAIIRLLPDFWYRYFKVEKEMGFEVVQKKLPNVENKENKDKK